MLNLLPRKETPESGAAIPAYLNLDHYLESLSSFLTIDSLCELYIHGADQDYEGSFNESTRSVTIYWKSSKIASFIGELAWECQVRIDPFRPYAGGVLPGIPWRWHAVIAPMSSGSPIVVLRRQLFDVLSLSNFHFNESSHGDLIDKVAAGTSIVIFGATGSGKTTLLMSILKHYFSSTRLGIAEVVEEIPLVSRLWFRILEVPPDAGGRGGVSMSKAMAEMMRLSPKVIVIGEIRGDEARVLGDVARTGHGGVLTTMHAGGFAEARNRLSTLSGLNLNQFPPICGLHVKQIGGRFSVSSEMLN
jgi:Flp pilus assembly CpaF family ATPase